MTPGAKFLVGVIVPCGALAGVVFLRLRSFAGHGEAGGFAGLGLLIFGAMALLPMLCINAIILSFKWRNPAHLQIAIFAVLVIACVVVLLGALG